MLLRGQYLRLNTKKIFTCLYRPYVKTNIYFDTGLIHRLGVNPEFFPTPESENRLIIFNGRNSVYWTTFASKYLVDLNALYGGAQCISLYRYTNNGRVENVTEWALNQFQKQYKDKSIGKEDIFYYVYSVLHHPAYRVKYEINLKREFPRIPFYEDFWKWAEWGKRLMDLHINFETMPPYPLERMDLIAEETRKALSPRLLARKEAGVIEVDTFTTLKGVPEEAWEYRLGTYSALEWVLERYKEKKPKDPTIAEKFNTYRFKDYKEQVIDLLGRVCAVSVETMKIVREMGEVE